MKRTYQSEASKRIQGAEQHATGGSQHRRPVSPIPTPIASLEPTRESKACIPPFQRRRKANRPSACNSGRPRAAPSMACTKACRAGKKRGPLPPSLVCLTVCRVFGVALMRVGCGGMRTVLWLAYLGRDPARPEGRIIWARLAGGNLPGLSRRYVV